MIINNDPDKRKEKTLRVYALTIQIDIKNINLIIIFNDSFLYHLYKCKNHAEINPAI